jgi:hypothetical protein
VEGENPGAVGGAWGDVIFILWYGVHSDANGGGVWGVTLLVVMIGVCWGWCRWVPDGVDLWCGQGGVVAVEWGTRW